MFSSQHTEPTILLCTSQIYNLSTCTLTRRRQRAGTLLQLDACDDTKRCGSFLLQCALTEIKASVSAAVNSIYFMIQQCLYLLNVSWLSTFSWRDLNYYSMHVLNASPKITSFLFWPHFYEENAWYCLYCYFPISTKKCLKMYFTELYYHVVFSKLLYFNEEVW